MRSKLFNFAIFFLVLVLSLVFVSSGELQVTQEHPFLVNGEWIEASGLQVGDILTTADGKKVRITNLEDIVSEDNFSVYNLEAGEYSNFVVGEDGVVVHNSKQIGERIEPLFRSKKGYAPFTKEWRDEKIDFYHYFYSNEVLPAGHRNAGMTVYQSMIKDGIISGSGRTTINQFLWKRHAEDYHLWGSTIAPEYMNERLLSGYLHGGDFGKTFFPGLTRFESGTEIGVVKISVRRGDLTSKLNPFGPRADVFNRLKITGPQLGSSWVNVGKGGLKISEDVRVIKNVLPVLGSSKEVSRFFFIRNEVTTTISAALFVVEVPVGIFASLYGGSFTGYKIRTYVFEEKGEKKYIIVQEEQEQN